MHYMAAKYLENVLLMASSRTEAEKKIKSLKGL